MVTLSSYNPCTLHMEGAMAHMHTELTGLHTAACGVQEARNPTTEARTYRDEWWVGSSACASKGQSGCQLWLSLITSWAVAKEKEVRLCSQNIFIIVAEPRLLIVKAVTSLFAILLIVAHGPHSSRPVVETVQFWQHATATVCKVAKGSEKKIMLADSNAHLFAATAAG